MKKIKTSMLALAIISGLFANSVNAAEANLIKNGSFENMPTTGRMTSTSKNVYFYRNYVDWVIENNRKLEIHVSPLQLNTDTYRAKAADGNVSVELNSDLNYPATIYQDFKTEPGTKLEVKFALTARKGYPSKLQVLMGAPGSEKAIGTFETTDYQNWLYQTATYVVPQNQTNTRIKFVSLNGGQKGPFGAGNDIDDVSVRVIQRPINPAEISVTTGFAKVQNETYAIVNGNTVSANLSNIKEVGIEYYDYENTNKALKVKAPSVAATYNVDLKNLQPETFYTYRAYAITTDNQVVYGNPRCFYTYTDCCSPFID